MPSDFLPLMQYASPCGYYPDRICSDLYTTSPWLLNKFGPNLNQTLLYSDLKEKGFCRYSNTFYINKCAWCNECRPIRLKAKDFKPSKSQRAVWRKNQDLQVKLKEAGKDPSDEEALLFREYDAYHNQHKADYKKMTLEEAKRQLSQMNKGYDGIWNMEYRLNDRLIGVGILDFTTNKNNEPEALCSNYFYYDGSPEIRKRSLGVYSVLQEISLCIEMGFKYYYLGLYLPGCKKMNYKANYQPCQILINGKWKKYSESCNKVKTPKESFKLPPPGYFSSHEPDICFITDSISQEFLKAAYQQGIFPWYNEDAGEPVIWRSPNPRFVIFPEQLHVSKSIKKFLKHNPYHYTIDTCFEEVMKNCGSMTRQDQIGSWIGPQMLQAYKKFFESGFVHSIEVWHGEKLVGGFYGVMVGSIFVGESMFTLEDNSSKSAFVLFAQNFFAKGGKLIDCQAYTDNMARYGAQEIPRENYLKLLKKYSKINFNFDNFSSSLLEKINLQ